MQTNAHSTYHIHMCYVQKMQIAHITSICAISFCYEECYIIGVYCGGYLIIIILKKGLHLLIAVPLRLKRPHCSPPEA